MLECVVNISEGRDADLIDEIAIGASSCVLDIHSDPWHNRSVITLAGAGAGVVEQAARRVAERAVQHLDIRKHSGAHPRLGVVDVVPFVELDFDFDSRSPGTGAAARGAATPRTPSAPTTAAAAAAEDFARFAGDELELPCFLYGADRSLPQVRKLALSGNFSPDTGPWTPHRTAGACCVGARPLLVAYNLWLDTNRGATMTTARTVARDLRASTPQVRTLAFDLDGRPQVSCNLIAPDAVGPQHVYDFVAERAPVDHAELVGLAPLSVLEACEPERWDQLGLSADTTIEARLAASGG